MNEIYNLNYKNPLHAFCEDIYFFKETGDVVFSRSGSGRKIMNIYSIFPPIEQKFLKDRLRYNQSGMIFVANSYEGPVLFQFSLIKHYKTFMAIIPNFTLSETLTFISSGLFRKVCLSDEVQNLLSNHKGGRVKSEYEILAKRINSLNFSSKESRIGITNEEIQSIAHEIAIILQDFCGCDLTIELTKIREEDLLNAFCVDSYAFALTCFCLTARNYAVDRKANIRFIFDQYGFCFDFSFEAMQEYKGMKIYDFSPEMKYFRYRADPLSFMFYVTNEENRYTMRTFTWQRELMYYGIKQKSRDDDDCLDFEFDVFDFDILE